MKKILYILLGLSGGAGILAYALVANANPLYVSPTVQTSTSTTTPYSFYTGHATTTLVYDSYKNPTGTVTLPDRAVLLLQFAGSSTASVLNTTIEYAQDLVGTDCAATPTNCDWYTDTQYTASSTPGVVSANIGFLISQKFASSTQGLAAVVSASGTSTRAYPISIPTRYVRAVFGRGDAGVANSDFSLWAQIVPNKQKTGL